MALLKKKTHTETKMRSPRATAANAPKKARSDAGASLTKGPLHLLKAPRITEKATYAIEKSTYVFEVSADATKNDIRTAVEALYKVTPRKVNIVNRPAHPFVSRTRNRRGTITGLKKAYVFLKKGDKLETL